VSLEGTLTRLEELGAFVDSSSGSLQEANTMLLPNLQRMAARLEALFEQVHRLEQMVDNYDLAVGKMEVMSSRVMDVYGGGTLKKLFGSLVDLATKTRRESVPMQWYPVDFIPNTSAELAAVRSSSGSAAAASSAGAVLSTPATSTSASTSNTNGNSNGSKVNGAAAASSSSQDSKASSGGSSTASNTVSSQGTAGHPPAGQGHQTSGATAGGAVKGAKRGGKAGR